MCATKFPTKKKKPSPCSSYLRKKKTPWYNFVFIPLFRKTRNAFIYNFFFNLTSISEQFSLKKQIKALKTQSPKYVCWCMRVCTHALCPWLSYNLILVLATWFCLGIRKASCGPLKMSSLCLLPVGCFQDMTFSVCFVRLPPHVCCLLSTSPLPRHSCSSSNLSLILSLMGVSSKMT